MFTIGPVHNSLRADSTGLPKSKQNSIEFSIFHSTQFDFNSILVKQSSLQSGYVHTGTHISVPSSFQFLECKNRLFTQEWNHCVSVFVSVHTRTLSFRSTVVSSVLSPFLATTVPMREFRAKTHRSIFGPDLYLVTCSHGTERNECV